MTVVNTNLIGGSIMSIELHELQQHLSQTQHLIRRGINSAGLKCTTTLMELVEFTLSLLQSTSTITDTIIHADDTISIEVILFNGVPIDAEDQKFLLDKTFVSVNETGKPSEKLMKLIVKYVIRRITQDATQSGDLK